MIYRIIYKKQDFLQLLFWHEIVLNLYIIKDLLVTFVWIQMNPTTTL